MFVVEDRNRPATGAKDVDGESVRAEREGRGNVQAFANVVLAAALVADVALHLHFHVA